MNWIKNKKTQLIKHTSRVSEELGMYHKQQLVKSNRDLP